MVETADKYRQNHRNCALKSRELTATVDLIQVHTIRFYPTNYDVDTAMTSQFSFSLQSLALSTRTSGSHLK